MIMFILFYASTIVTLFIGIIIGLYLDKEKVFKIPKTINRKINKEYGAVFIPEEPKNQDEEDAENIENNILKNIGATKG